MHNNSDWVFVMYTGFICPISAWMGLNAAKQSLGGMNIRRAIS